mgnify:CR=1 FL=1
MSGWGAGYVTDVTYIPGYYRQQSPAHLDMIARLSGIAFHLPEDFTWVELGCGVGFGAAIIARSSASTSAPRTSPMRARWRRRRGSPICASSKPTCPRSRTAPR